MFFQRCLRSKPAMGNDFVTGCRHTLHLHPTFGSYEEDLGFGLNAFDGIGYAECGEYVASCATSANYDSNGLHFLSFSFYLFVITV